MGDPMAGLLIYTAAPDSEGTLGGLVSLGEPETLGRHLDHALEIVRLCCIRPLVRRAPADSGIADAPRRGVSRLLVRAGDLM